MSRKTENLLGACTTTQARKWNCSARKGNSAHMTSPVLQGMAGGDARYNLNPLSVFVKAVGGRCCA